MDTAQLRTLRDRFATRADQFPNLHHLLISGGEFQPDWLGTTHLSRIRPAPPGGADTFAHWVEAGAYDNICVSFGGTQPVWSFWKSNGLVGYYFGRENAGEAIKLFEDLAGTAWRSLPSSEQAGERCDDPSWEWQRWLLRLYRAAWNGTVGLRATRQTQVVVPPTKCRSTIDVDAIDKWRQQGGDSLVARWARSLSEPPQIWSAVLEPTVFLASALYLDSAIAELDSNPPASRQVISRPEERPNGNAVRAGQAFAERHAKAELDAYAKRSSEQLDAMRPTIVAATRETVAAIAKFNEPPAIDLSGLPGAGDDPARGHQKLSPNEQAIWDALAGSAMTAKELREHGCCKSAEQVRNDIASIRLKLGKAAIRTHPRWGYSRPDAQPDWSKLALVKKSKPAPRSRGRRQP
jgi:hypothetical protein